MKKHIFQWSGLNQKGEIISGNILSSNMSEVKQKLAQQNINIEKIQKKSRLFLSKKYHGPTLLDIAIFFRQLATLIFSGVPILQSCEMLKHTQKNIVLQQIIHYVKLEIANGKSFSEALKPYPEYIDTLTRELLHIGIQSGNFSTMLARIATYQEKKLLLHKKIKQALFYPMMVSIIAIFVSIIMLIFVVPKFADLFHETNKPLPMITQCVISFSHWISHDGFLLLIPPFAIFLFWDILKNSHRIREKIEYCYLKFSIFQKMQLIHLIRNLMMTLSAGIPILKALEFSGLASPCYVYQEATKKLQREIMSGHPLYQAMQQIPHFPILCIHMIKIGEESGSLEKMLEKMLELFESDVDHFISNLSQLLEPLIMVVLGVLIGGLVIAMYLPIFQLGTAL